MTKTRFIVAPFNAYGDPILNGKGQSLCRDDVWATDEAEAREFFMNRFTTSYWVEQIPNYRLDVIAY